MDSTIELTLDGIAHGGEAIGRSGAKVIFVPYAIPGERVRVELVEVKERWARARLLEVLTASPDRVEPPCPYFGPYGCGGCQWQHIGYDRQAELKREILADLLRRLGRIASPPVADIIVLEEPVLQDTGDPRPTAPGEAVLLEYAYLNEARFLLTAEDRLGFRDVSGQRVVAIDRCLLVHERIDELHSALDVAGAGLIGVRVRAGVNTGQALIVLETASEEEPQLEIDLPSSCVLLTPLGVQTLIGEDWIEEEVGGRRYRISANSPFEENTAGAAALVDLVTSYADVHPGDVVLDAYCGVGLFAIPLADSAAEVIGIEPSSPACEDFAFNARERSNLSLHEGAVGAVLDALHAQGQRIDIALLEPPGADAGPEVIGNLGALGPRRIVYVSNDAAALARDCVHLAGIGYRLIEVQPIDLFPQTYQVKTVTLWEKG